MINNYEKEILTSPRHVQPCLIFPAPLFPPAIIACSSLILLGLFKWFLLTWENLELILPFLCVFGYTPFTRTRKIDMRLSFLIFQRWTGLKIFLSFFSFFFFFLLKSTLFTSLAAYATSQVIVNEAFWISTAVIKLYSTQTDFQILVTFTQSVNKN